MMGTPISGRVDAVEKPEIDVRVEEELGDGAAGTRVHLAFQIVDVDVTVGRLGVGLRIGRDTDIEVGDPLQPGHQIAGEGDNRPDGPRSDRLSSGGSPRSATM